MKIRRAAWLPRRPQTAPSFGVALALALVLARVNPALAELDHAPIVVALDPGHGGTNLGAPGPVAGLYEKNVTLALAERVRDLLEAPSAEQARGQPGFRVVLCRTADRLVPIRARARCAQQSGARLFLSLHANAVPAGVTPGSQHGFEVFVLGPREIEDDAALAALRERDDAEAAWQAHVVRAAGERSISLARFVDEALARELGAGARRGVKQSGAALDVLRGAGTPAALVEVGFLDDPPKAPDQGGQDQGGQDGDGARLAVASGREPIARALAAAVRAFVQTSVEDGSAPAKLGRLRSPGRPAAPPSRGHVQARLQAHADATARTPAAAPANSR